MNQIQRIEDAQTRHAVAEPDPRAAISDRHGNSCRAARPDSYPLSGLCKSCGLPIRCADGTADWYHIVNDSGRCGFQGPDAAVTR